LQKIDTIGDAKEKSGLAASDGQWEIRQHYRLRASLMRLVTPTSQVIPKLVTCITAYHLP